MNNNETEKFFLYLERNRIYTKKNFKKLSLRKKTQIIDFISNLKFNKKKDIRYLNLVMKFENVIGKKLISLSQIRKII
tara:strand:- start:163 stop:396 length:234 start_codon:yes stop_codon:yes gene_type:complete